MSKTKQQQYRTIVQEFIQTYGSDILDNQKNPVVFNITGPYRNKIHKQSGWDLFIFIAFFSAIAWFISVYVAGVAFCIILIRNCYQTGQLLNDDATDIFDGEILKIDGRMIGVAIPTQMEEGDLESQNLRETGDVDKLTRALDKARVHYKDSEIALWSTGTSSSQCIKGHEIAPFCEFDMGIENWSDAQIAEFLIAHSRVLTHDGVLVFLNSVGYAIRVDAGIVYNDNKVEYDTVTNNIAPRTIGATGNNEGVMEFARRLVHIHRKLDCNYILAIVPRGDKTMPQGGSHSKQRVLDHYRSGDLVILLEVSGKQTKMFEVQNNLCGADDTAEHICKNIKETKIVDVSGKTYGSGVVFA